MLPQKERAIVNTEIRKCDMYDLEMLCELSRSTYRDTFAHLNTPENMDSYLAISFAPQKIACELSNPASCFYFLFADGELAGYLKLNEAPAQSDINDPLSLELERIYVKSGFQCGGLGRTLLEKAVLEAQSRGKRYLWLGVWEKNDKALAFYRKNGFYPIGTHTFVMGDDRQTDFIMRKDL